MLGEFFAADPLLAAIGFAGQDQRFAVVAEAPQYGGAAVVEQQQDRQIERRDVFQLAAQNPCLQPGPGGGAGQQVQTQALLVQRQAGTQAGATDRRAMQFAEDQQTVE
ncbi:hypothetical protein D3C87_1388340 [compost metagenome]